MGARRYFLFSVYYNDSSFGSSYSTLVEDPLQRGRLIEDGATVEFLEGANVGDCMELRSHSRRRASLVRLGRLWT